MTTPAVLPHMDAVQEALEGQSLTVGLGGAPSPVPASRRYAALYFAPGRSMSESLADRRTDFGTVFQVTCVGPTVEECLWVADKVRKGLDGALVVTGRKAWRPEADDTGPPVQRDDDVTPPLYFVPLQYNLKSTS